MRLAGTVPGATRDEIGERRDGLRRVKAETLRSSVRISTASRRTLAFQGPEVSAPVAPIERSVLDGFGEMSDGQAFRSFEICNRPRNLQNAIVSASGEALLLHGALEQLFGICAEFAIRADLAGVHLRIGV